MTPADILAKFLTMFPNYQETIHDFRPTSTRGISVTMHDGMEVHFIYFDEFNWSLSARKGNV